MRSAIRFGVGIPNCREGLYYPPGFASPRQVVETGAMVEELGFDSVWANDHYTAPNYVKDMWKNPPAFYEPMVTLTAIACRTRKVKLGVAVIVLPIREPIVLAKTAMTLDAVSAGRLILGVGLGSYKEEFTAACAKRGGGERPRILDDRLAALRKILTERNATFDGQYTNFENIDMFPRGRRPLPVYVGGNAEKGLDRVANYGDGWIPTGLGPEEIEEKIGVLRNKLARRNRTLSEIEVAPQFTACIRKNSDEAFKIYRDSALFKHITTLKDATFRGRQVEDSASKNLVGSVDEVIAKIEKFAKHGVQHFSALLFVARDLVEYKQSVKLFAKEILPLFR